MNPIYNPTHDTDQGHTIVTPDTVSTNPRVTPSARHLGATLSLVSSPTTSTRSLMQCPHERRAEVEKFIRAVYQANFHAQPSQLLPHLLVSFNPTHHIDFALGMKPADEGKLFLEQYLDQPVEHYIESLVERPIERHTIAEIGNLAATHAGAMRSAITACTHWLFEAGYEWVVFTGTRALRNGFSRLGLAPTPIAQASIQRLPAAAQTTWGTYFDHQPELYVGNITEGHLSLP